MTHALKTWPEYYRAAEEGIKTFELRKMDRNFKVGDKVLLQKFDPQTQSYTGEEIERKITYILSDCPKFGLKPGFGILGLEPVLVY